MEVRVPAVLGPPGQLSYEPRLHGSSHCLAPQIVLFSALSMWARPETFLPEHIHVKTRLRQIVVI